MPTRPDPLTSHLSRRQLTTGAALAVAGLLAGCTSPPNGQTGPGPTSGASSPSGGSSPGASPAPPGTGSSSSPAPLPARVDVATGLKVPWSMVALPDGTVLVSERDTAAVKRIRRGQAAENVGTVPGVRPGGEGGLLGLTIERGSFPTNPVLYAYFTAESDNRVAAIPLGADGAFGTPQVILDGIPRASNHNGGRLAFGPDGFLYVSTGDAQQTGNAQDLRSLGGKILRITNQGAAATGNPFGDSRVWSYGHRNVQGMAWDAAGRMYASEFGQNTWDELNVITAGGNYGWPTVEGIARRQGFVDPAQQWATDEASPSGLTIGPDGALYMAALKGESLWRMPLGPDGAVGQPQRLLQDSYGRLRDVMPAPDGRLWVLTNNTARGAPRSGDDRIVSIALGDLR